MNAMKLYVDVYQKWAEGQMKTGQAWVESMQNLKQFDPSQVWDKTIEAYQTSVQETLDAEVASTQIWFEEVVTVKDQPKPVVELTKHMQETTNTVAEMQQTFVDNWFNFLGQIDLSGFALAVTEEPKKKPARKTTKKA